MLHLTVNPDSPSYVIKNEGAGTHLFIHVSTSHIGKKGQGALTHTEGAGLNIDELLYVVCMFSFWNEVWAYVFRVYMRGQREKENWRKIRKESQA